MMKTQSNYPDMEEMFFLLFRDIADTAKQQKKHPFPPYLNSYANKGDLVTHFHSAHCVIPPYILEKIAARGSEAQRDKALATLQSTDQFREQRVSMSMGGAGMGVSFDGPMAAVVPPSPNQGKQRVVYSALNLGDLPGKTLRREGESPCNDLAADEAYDGAGATYDLYWNVYLRDSIDGNGMRLDSTVHYENSYDNAFWNGQQMVYGDGDEDLPVAQRLFNRFTVALDVIGHELTHGVIQYTSNLIYQNQPGALNESLADVFGVLVKQYKLKQSAKDADWIIGQGLFTTNILGVGIRSMKAPGTAYNDPLIGKDPQPAHMQNYVDDPADNGGVHINSGIPNHAFYLTAQEIGGFAWEKTGRIWYAAMRDRINSTTNFQGMANLTYEEAGNLFGANSPEQQAVRNGWVGVGIQIEDAPVVPPVTTTNPGCMASLIKLLKGQ
jgi:Zn-dependent metalloprotease